jgi:hypothetical protein
VNSSCSLAVSLLFCVSSDKNLSMYGGGVPLFLAYRQDMPVVSVKVAEGGQIGYQFIDKNLRAQGVIFHMLRCIIAVAVGILVVAVPVVAVAVVLVVV